MKKKQHKAFTLPEISVALIVLFIMTALTLKYYIHERRVASIDTFKTELATIIDAFVFGGVGGASGYIYGTSQNGFCSAHKNYLDNNLTMGRLYLCVSEDYNHSILHKRVFYQNDSKVCGLTASIAECNSTTGVVNTTYFRSIYVPECIVMLNTHTHPDNNLSARMIIDCQSGWSTLSEDQKKFRISALIKSSAFLQRIQNRYNPKLAIPEDDDPNDGNISLLFPERQL